MCLNSVPPTPKMDVQSKDLFITPPSFSHHSGKTVNPAKNNFIFSFQQFTFCLTHSRTHPHRPATKTKSIHHPYASSYKVIGPAQVTLVNFQHTNTITFAKFTRNNKQHNCFMNKGQSSQFEESLKIAPFNNCLFGAKLFDLIISKHFHLLTICSANEDFSKSSANDCFAFSAPRLFVSV